jgi:hypothetical protein
MELKHFTDKGTGGLFEHYEKMFADLQDKRMRYLEIGILHGGSLEWASKFFKQGEIIGADLNILPETEDIDAVKIKVNQSDIPAMEKIGEDFGSFDIIIDDGSHIRELTENTFNAFWKYVKPNGIYIIEDWSAGYTDFPQYKGMVDLVVEIILKKNKYGISDIIVINERKSFVAFRKK